MAQSRYQETRGKLFRYIGGLLRNQDLCTARSVRCAVQMNDLVHDPDAISGNTDHPLHVVLPDVERVLEDDDVAALHFLVGQKMLALSSPGGA